MCSSLSHASIFLYLRFDSGIPASSTLTTTITPNANSTAISTSISTSSSTFPTRFPVQTQENDTQATILVELDQARSLPIQSVVAGPSQTEMALPLQSPNTTSPNEISNGSGCSNSQEPLCAELQPIVILPSSKAPMTEKIFTGPGSCPNTPGSDSRRRSLKRKQMHDHDENNNALDYPYNLSAIYPNKRRTPPREEIRDIAGAEMTVAAVQSPNNVSDGQLQHDVQVNANTVGVEATPTAVEASSQNLALGSDDQVISEPIPERLTSSSSAPAPLEQKSTPMKPIRPKSISEINSNSAGISVKHDTYVVPHQQPSTSLSNPSTSTTSSTTTSSGNTNWNASVLNPNAEPESKPKSNSSPSSSFSPFASPAKFNGGNSSTNPFAAFSSYSSPTSKGKAAVASPFSAFSSGSGFGSSSPFSPFSSKSTTTTPGLRPIWSLSNGNDDGQSSTFGDDDGSTPLVFGDGNGSESKSVVDGSASEAKNGSKGDGMGSFNHKTGEEEETVECELKGVKLFIKRGTKEYSSGMLGHVKLLSSKGQDAERLLFRREPLWKISMNARLQPTVRCSFDSEESILRVILPESSGACAEEGSSGSGDGVEKESSSSDKQSNVNSSSSKSGADGGHEIVVYAMKVGI
ncbi:hypothetical protein D9758_011192 [Tetrapyrgos nigripes]|uniref:RanBD1 domain-containing protein n=1 Tax=Tetrapyrgos nigripes TaxID=182062 RepID=A0A8H5D6P3_9AGAR|nr:hypothetical protein D9758_011192 [Tetrapyrgos nigripes]